MLTDGDQSAAIGGTLRFDQFNHGTSTTLQDLLEDVILIGGGITLTIDMPDIVDAGFQHRQVGLDVSAGWVFQSVPGPGDPPATPQQFQTVMTNLDFLLINGEFRGGDDRSGLDNVFMTDDPVPTPSTLAVLGVAIGTLACRRKSGSPLRGSGSTTFC